jgi:hypothetical protein
MIYVYIYLLQLGNNLGVSSMVTEGWTIDQSSLLFLEDAGFHNFNNNTSITLISAYITYIMEACAIYIYMLHNFFIFGFWFSIMF